MLFDRFLIGLMVELETSGGGGGGGLSHDDMMTFKNTRSSRIVEL